MIAGAKRKQGHAITGSSGIAYATAQKLSSDHQRVAEYHLSTTEIEGELERLAAAIVHSSEALETEIAQLKPYPDAHEIITILQAQQMMLNDPELLQSIRMQIVSDGINAEWAVKRNVQRIQSVFEQVDDDYLRSRKEDVDHVGRRIIKALSGGSQVVRRQGSIVVAETFSPVELIALWREGVPAFVAEQGGRDSHTMIVARGLGLTGIVGADGLYNQLEDGDTLMVDAEHATWILNPDTSDLQQYEQLRQKLEDERNHLQPYLQKESVSKDGVALPLMANVEFYEEVELALANGAEGIGLFRTEYQFMQSDTLPDETQIYEGYASVVKSMAGRPVTFRLLDISMEKVSTKYGLLPGYKCENPALGLRGVRLLLRVPELLRLQLRAIIRVASLAPVSILVPMVTKAEEMVQIRNELDQLCDELGSTTKLALGAMIEVPAAALMAEEIARVSDFFSIGSNDLLQYSLAVDRTDKDVSYLYDASHGGILKLIEHTVNAAEDAAIPVMVCGELAADRNWTQTFLNMKVSALSMTSSQILSMRKHLHHLQAV